MYKISFGRTYISAGSAQHAVQNSELFRLFIFLELNIHETAEGLFITPVGRTFVRNIAMTYDAYLNGNQSDKASTFSRTI